MFSTRKVTTSIAAVAVAATIALSSVFTASAHVTVGASTDEAGSYSVLKFAFSHGCDGAATTKIAIQIPDDIILVRPGVNALWDVEKVTEDLATPVPNGHGGEYTERVSEVVYTAKAPIADGFYAALEVQVQLPETVGEIVYFPVVQTCETGETAWIQIPAAGQTSDDLESPAPSITITEASEGGH